MAQGFTEQTIETPSSINIAAGSATNATYLAYIDMRDYRRSGLEVIFTAGGSGGTLVFTVGGTVYEFKNLGDAKLNDSGSIFQDISSAILGSSTKTSSFLVTDSLGITGCLTFLKLSAVINNSDTSTALVCKINKCS
jgi:hypothetical protein